MKPQPPTPQQLPLEKIDPSTFAFADTRIASAQICQSVGFTSARRSALNTLTDVAATYLRALARSAAASAHSSGQTQPTLHDVVLALDDLAASAHGFPGAWDQRRPTLADLSRFIARSDEIPFAKPLPCPPPPSPVFMKVGLLEKRGRVRFKMGLCVGMGAVQSIFGRFGCTRQVPRGSHAALKIFSEGEGVGEVGEGFVGVDLRSKVCMGGKRVSCHQNRNVDNKEEEGHMKKRRRKSSSNDVPRNYI